MSKALSKTRERLPAVSRKLRALVAASRSEATRTAYRADWAHFNDWCVASNRPSLPATPETVGEYVADMSESFRPSTINRRLAAISVVHKGEQHPSPCSSELVRSAVAGVQRTVGTAQVEKRPVRVKDIREIVSQSDDSIRSLRNSAILLVGYAGALRRSELVALNMSDIEQTDEGMTLTVRKSKTDQTSKGLKKGIPFGRHEATCPVKNLFTWLEAACIERGPIFRSVTKGGVVSSKRLSDRAVSEVIKELAAQIGIDPAEVAGHSLRAGLITDAFAQGFSETAIMSHTGHKSRAVLGRYHREANLFKSNVAGGVDL